MKNILVPTDFSKCSVTAIKYAIALTKKTKSKIVFFHSTSLLVPTRSTRSAYAMAIKEDLEKKEKKLQGFISRIYKSLHHNQDKRSIKLIVKSGASAVKNILETSQEHNIDLIIMGTVGAGGIKKLLIGSNTAKIISMAACPVIAIPERGTFKKLTTIAYATDYHLEDLAAIKELASIAKPFKAHINVIHIYSGEFTYTNEKEYITEFAKDVKARCRYQPITFQLIYGQKIEDALEEYMTKKSIDLFAMTTKHRTLVEKLFSNSITKRLVYHTKVPLMAFPY